MNICNEAQSRVTEVRLSGEGSTACSAKKDHCCNEVKFCRRVIGMT